MAPIFAKKFGVSRQTMWRDLQALMFPPRQTDFVRGDELLYSVFREYPGGPIISVTDADGNEIRGADRQEILRRVPRYRRRRRR
ncbi:MAG: hypothetical protein WCK05_04045 [Planctomycetota bacterium]